MNNYLIEFYIDDPSHKQDVFVRAPDALTARINAHYAHLNRGDYGFIRSFKIDPIPEGTQFIDENGDWCFPTLTFRQRIERAISQSLTGIEIDYHWLRREGEEKPETDVWDLFVEFQNDKVDLTFDMLECLAKVLNTKKINIDFSAGWSGTDVTPGSPGSIGLYIGLQ